MRAFSVCLIVLMAAAAGSAMAQNKTNAKLPSSTNETRYFTSIDGLMDGNADVILRENYQGKTVTSAVLDVCYPAAKGSDRKDRFVANLAVNGQTMTGTTQSIGDKLPVSVNLTRKQTGDTYEFKGQIRVGQTATNVVSSDNADLSEKEFRENQTNDDGIVPAPKDFTQVSPEAIAVKVKLDNAADLLKYLKGQNVGIAVNSLAVSCESLRSGQMTLNLSVDPQRAADLLANVKTQPGITGAGWTSGLFDMERTLRFAATDWQDGARPNRDKLAAAIGAVAAKVLSAKIASSTWSDETGKLTLLLKRPSDMFPALAFTETIELNAMVAPDRPGASDHLMLWISGPSITTADESSPPKLNLIDTSTDDDEGDQNDEYGIVDALAKEFKAQRWDLENTVWK
ncbi:hypothetical protein ACWX0K_10180 [Nitrobacteraceae bacterium UC4446_H13]